MKLKRHEASKAPLDTERLSAFDSDQPGFSRSRFAKLVGIAQRNFDRGLEEVFGRRPVPGVCVRQCQQQGAVLIDEGLDVHDRDPMIGPVEYCVGLGHGFHPTY